MPMNHSIKKYLSQIGQKGGRKSRRVLDSKDAKKMLQIREARRAFRECYAQCFWSFDPNYKISATDVPWVIEQLLKNGNQRTLKYVRYICR